MSVKRDEIPYLNLLRVAAIFLVILLHCVNPYFTNPGLFGQKSWWICNVLNSFSRMGVPCFFMISGYLLLRDDRTRDIGQFYKKRLPRILIPLFFWNVFYFLYYRLAFGQPVAFSDFFREILNNGSAYHLWFVYTMLGFYLLLPFFKRIVDACTPKQLLIFYLIIFFIGTIRPLINRFTPDSFYLYLFDPPICGYAGFFILGYLLGQYKIKKSVRALLYFGGVAGILLGVLGSYWLSSPDRPDFFFNGGYQINNILAPAALFTLVRHIGLKRDIPFSRFLSRYAKRTFGIYFIHVLIMDLMGNYRALDLSPVGMAAVFFAVTTITGSVLIFVLSKSKLLRKIIM